MQSLDSSWYGGIGGASRASPGWREDLYYRGDGDVELLCGQRKSRGEWREGVGTD